MSRSGPPPRQGRIRGAGDKTLRDASSRATKAFYPALSLCDLIFSGVFERHTRPTLAIVEFELAWAPHLLSTMDYTYRERHGEAIYRFESLPPRRRGACPREGGGTACSRSDFFRRKMRTASLCWGSFVHQRAPTDHAGPHWPRQRCWHAHALC